ncbi:MAG: hypothetical protein ACO1QR_14915 [Chthoniobacteraceae bacterium]
MKRLVIALIALLVFGALKLPFEHRLFEEHRRAFFHAAELNLSMREQIGQGGFIAALSGFRSVVADLLWIRAYIAWTDTEWGRMKVLFDAVTSLQPRALEFWDTAHWHMAFNASVAAIQNEDQPRLALRQKAEREYWQLGEAYLKRGISFNPDRALLYDRLGALYMDPRKFNDPCRAAEAYAEAAKRPDAMPYVHRLALYNLARCPGHEREGYDALVKLYHKGKEERLLTLLTLIDELEEKLQIPEEQRIDTAADIKEATPR